MPQFSPEHAPIQAALGAIALPELSSLSVLDALTKIHINNQRIELELTLGYPCQSQWPILVKAIQAGLSDFAPQVDVKLTWQAPTVVANSSLQSITGVKNIIAVASGKGGVGKSTTAVNVALALAAEGAKVGMLDADIYGPSQSLMLGVRDQRPEMYSANQMKPIMGVGGIAMMSMGNLVTENTPMVWRGPMVSGALQQLLNQTHWGDLDYLIIDMPPGTGDIQLTLSQSVPVSAALIVTTPQDIALLDARKGIEMFQKVNIPVLGIVENMSLHTCTQCGHEEAVFGTLGGDTLAAEYGVEVLGRLPLLMSICAQTDKGTPPVIQEPDSEVAKKYCEIARCTAAQLFAQQTHRPIPPKISISDD